MSRFHPCALGGALLLAFSPHSLASPQDCGHRLAILGPDRYLGRSVSLSANLALLSPSGDKQKGQGAGAAFVFRRRRASGLWTKEAKLVGADTDTFDHLGSALALDGWRAVVGANGDDPANENLAGSAYVFVRDATGSWTQEAKLVPADSVAGLGFGDSAAIHGDVVVVGGGGDPFGGVDGGAFVFRRDPTGGGWIEEQRLTPSDGWFGDRFGLAVSVHGERIAVAASRDDDQGTRSGSVYVFRRDVASGDWNEEQKLVGSKALTEAYFGMSVSLDADRLVVGAGTESTTALDAGAAYVFHYDAAAGAWMEEARLESPNAVAHGWFGLSVAAAGDTALVGEPNAGPTGRVQLYRRDTVTGSWLHEREVRPASKASKSQYGRSVANDQRRLLVGSWLEGGTDGAAYVHALVDVPLGASYCGPGVPNSTGLAGRLVAFGSDVVADKDVCLLALDLPPLQTTRVLASPIQGFVPQPGGSQGNLCLANPIGRFPFDLGGSGPGGAFSLPIDLTRVPTPSGSTAVQPGETWNFQVWYRDSNPTLTSNFTDAVSIVFP